MIVLSPLDSLPWYRNADCLTIACCPTGLMSSARFVTPPKNGIVSSLCPSFYMLEDVIDITVGTSPEHVNYGGGELHQGHEPRSGRRL